MTRAQAELAALRAWQAYAGGNSDRGRRSTRHAFIQGYVAAQLERQVGVPLFSPKRQSGALPMPARSVAAATSAVRVGGRVGEFFGSIARALGGGRQ